MEAHMPDNTLPHLLPMSKRKRARLDRQSERQRRYEEKLKEKKAPTREDFAAAALDLVLGVIENFPQTKQARMARSVLVDELVAAGFDNIQCRMRLDGMCERLEKDRARRRYLCNLAAQNEAAVAGAPSTGDPA
jgi:hypothetical protein